MSADDLGEFVNETGNLEQTENMVVENVFIGINETGERGGLHLGENSTDGSVRGDTGDNDLGSITPGRLNLEVMLRQMMQENAEANAENVKANAELVKKMAENAEKAEAASIKLIQEIRSEIRDFKTEIREKEEKAEARINQEIAEVKGELRRVTRDLREERGEKIEEVRAEMQQARDRLNREQNAAGEAVKAKMKEHEEETRRVSDRSVMMENVVVGCEGKISKVEEGMAEIKARIEGLESKPKCDSNRNNGGSCNGNARNVMRMSRTYREHDIPKFRGTEGEHPRKHIERLKDFFAIYECEDVEKVFVAKRSVIGRCANWLAMYGQNLNTFVKFEDSFLHEYWCARIQGKDRAALYQETCRVGQMEEHLVRVVERAKFFDQPMTDTDIITLVYSHTPKEVRRSLVGKEYKTVAELRDVLAELDQLGEPRHEEQRYRPQGYIVYEEDRGEGPQHGNTEQEHGNTGGNGGGWRSRNNRGGFQNVNQGFYYNRGGYQNNRGGRYGRGNGQKGDDNGTGTNGDPTQEKQESQYNNTMTSQPGDAQRVQSVGEQQGARDPQHIQRPRDQRGIGEQAPMQGAREQQGYGRDEQQGNGRGRAT